LPERWLTSSVGLRDQITIYQWRPHSSACALTIWIVIPGENLFYDVMSRCVPDAAASLLGCVPDLDPPQLDVAAMDFIGN
jgi:hypothetical protein